jgi:hypothetical protein
LGKGGGKSTTTVEPQPVNVPSQLQPWLDAAMRNVIGTMPYLPMQQFAQPNPQKIPDLTPQQYRLVNDVMSQAYNPSVYRPGNDAMNITAGALGLGPGGPSPTQPNFQRFPGYGFGPMGPAPEPFQPLPMQGTQGVLPPWNQPPPEMGWVPGIGGNGPTWGVTNPTPGWVPPAPPPLPTALQPGAPGYTPPPGTYVDDIGILRQGPAPNQGGTSGP